MKAAKPLHIATSLKIVAKHMHVAKPTILAVRNCMQRLAAHPYPVRPF